MPQEIELKFDIAPEILPRLESAPLLRKLAGSGKRDARKREELVSVYFDTVRHALRERGLTLRIRHNGGRRIQTIKASGAPGSLARGEWESEVESDLPDLRDIDATPLAALNAGKRGRKLARKLRPVFATEISRASLPLKTQGGAIELAIDQGNIRIGDRVRPVHEIELELKEGDPAALIAIARQLVEAFPLRYSVLSKAERGHALAAEQEIEPGHSEPIQLDPTISCGAGFQAIGLSCLRQVMRNEPAVVAGQSEGVHQMRVGLRRLRAAISLFKDILEDAETEDIKGQLKWLTEQLAPARDYDVFVTESLAPLQDVTARQEEVARLKTMMEGDRKDRFRRAKAVVAGDDFRRITCAAALWLCVGDWSRSSDPLIAGRRDRPLRLFAREVLQQRTKKILKRVGKLDRLDQMQRHKLRIAVKKLRYATEFFATLFDGSTAAHTAFAKVLKRLQGALGKLNDIAVHERLADQMLESGKGDHQASFAMGLVSGRETAESEALLAAAGKAGRKLAKMPGFWA